jgi:hypothetical protein
MSYEIVAAVVSLAVVIVVALLRSVVGESESDKAVKRGQSVLHMLKVVTQVAQDAILMVEGQLKEESGKSPQELHEAAVEYAAQALAALGVTIDPEVLSMIAVAVESAYQRFKHQLERDELPEDVAAIAA